MEKTLKQELQAIVSKLDVTTPTPNDPIWQTELTDDEVYRALYELKRTKHFALKAEQEREAKLIARQNALQPWNYQQQLNNAVKMATYYAKAKHKRFVMDEFMRPLYHALSLYFVNDPEFETLDKEYKLWKGIMLVGDPGVGKTDILLSFQINKKQPYMLVSCDEIRQSVCVKGIAYLPTYLKNVPGHGGMIDSFFKLLTWGFDDVGREQPLNLYGDKTECLPYLLHEYYRMLKNRNPIQIPHLSSNYNLEQLEERYDYTVVSRIKELYNIFILQGPDRREL